MRLRKTSRGFTYRNFLDRNGVECSIQQSSLATEEAIWFGANKIGVREFVAGREPNAWVSLDYMDEAHGMDKHYVANNRMHLTRKQLKKLLPTLIKFVETGEL